ncbi:MAG: hypothetical protein PF503_21900 [Desulfobacula sp.]|nr:hypothetical protein [Desulfobacula sp.]
MSIRNRTPVLDVVSTGVHGGGAAMNLKITGLTGSFFLLKYTGD